MFAISVSQPFVASRSQFAERGVHIAIEQVPPVHDDMAFGNVQRVPQAPQFSGSDCRSTQVSPQRLGVMGVQPLVQVRVATPPSPMTTPQVGVAPEQLIPQAPQAEDCERSVSHPFIATVSQSPKPAAQCV
jgi:hypothetical protein